MFKFEDSENLFYNQIWNWLNFFIRLTSLHCIVDRETIRLSRSILLYSFSFSLKIDFNKFLISNYKS